MEKYIYKKTIQHIVENVLPTLTINKDYVIAGGFVRDSALDLEPKDIDIFIKDGTFSTELDFELMIASVEPIHFQTLGNPNPYNDSMSIMPPPAPTWRGARIEADEHDALIRGVHINQEFTMMYGGVTTTLAPSKPVSQNGKTISSVQEVHIRESYFPLNFIHCTIDKGFTPENVIDTFDYDLVQGYVKDDLSLALPKGFEKAVEKKTVTIWDNFDRIAAQKTLSRVSDWLNRNSKMRKQWKFEVKPRNQTFEEGATGENLPVFETGEAISIIDALIGLNFVASKKEARRLIEGGGARINGEVISDENAMISSSSDETKLSAGKKKHGILRFT